MARMTAAQLNAIFEEEARQAAEREREAYPQRFLLALSAALQENFELQSVDPVSAEYVLFDRDDSNIYNVFASHTASKDAQWKLEQLEYAVNDKAAARKEAERVYSVRQAALAKAKQVFTDEERKLLNL
jgi:hypothetical protein